MKPLWKAIIGYNIGVIIIRESLHLESWSWESYAFIIGMATMLFCAIYMYDEIFGRNK